ncbi:MAG: DUF4139 domain-containing protein [Anaerolineae bacterium]
MQLGVDNRVRVKRELLKRDVGKNMLGNVRRTVFSYKITLTNLVPTSSKITVFDQLPVSRHENIKVKLLEAAPETSEQSELNILQWTRWTSRPIRSARWSSPSAWNTAREMQIVRLG